jgi:3-oxoacyl-[acyl-carrier-protein] synthase-1
LLNGKENGDCSKHNMAYLTSDNIITSLGNTTKEVISNIEKETTGIDHHHPYLNYTKAPISMVNSKKIQEEITGIFSDTAFTRFESLAILSLHDALKNCIVDAGSPKTLFILSTTKGNIELLKQDVKPSDQIFLHNTAQKIAGLFGFIARPVVVCNACISGVLAILLAKRYIDSGKYDNVVVTGVDIVTEFVVAGFESFKSMSEKPCKPFDANRDGLSLGEGAGTVIISREKKPKSIKIVNGSSANDANHISGPSRTGEGLYLAAKNALLSNHKIDFISAHGTATQYNDDMESHAINRLHISEIPVNSFKGYFGHTLGAAGVIETILTKHSMLNNILYTSLGMENAGVASPLNVVTHKQKKTLSRCLKLSSGFGGCNAAIVLEKDE